MYSRSELAMLSYDERILAQRKLAIQMYGYSWLKPAGCTKTMLGRREEELEREEVERQLRDAEMQERNQAEADEAERQAHLDQQRAAEARGEDIAEGERDLDDEVPDMDAEEGYEDEESEEEDDDGEADLDDDIPEGDSGWAYDTTRDPDTESESSSLHVRNPPQPRAMLPGNRQPPNITGQHGMSDAMIDQDEMGQYAQDYDLDDEVPDMDASLRDLDEDVPDADDDGGWEHTDTELEESDMDISIMPPGVTAHQLSMPPPSSGVSQRQQSRLLARQSNASEQSDMSTGMRRTSGNIPLPMGPPAQPASIRGGRRGLPRTQHLPANFTPDQLGSDLSISALISTGNTDMDSDNRGAQGQRSWLNPASARRNLFGRNSNPPAQPAGALSRNVSGQQAIDGAAENSIEAPRQVSSGGLFTPSPQHQLLQRHQLEGMSSDEPRSRTRSGRMISGNRGGRRA
ncbi:hypothetical protein PMZ80_006389 [Knufia obscura]|uniref:Uncharacterized protein n=2 Tax=Knufia TaxID=430999 RepID=A0AAN8I5T0_9EURO|nr:hypothetical protein PMZ80_006389 [Knufia obscura]KAK5953464.1 hypothetical protein OHC33_005408 [Knufia fluminis]